MPNTKDLRGSVAIAGVGLAACGEAPGWTENEIMAAAAQAALADAGLTTYAVKALYAGLLLHRKAAGGGAGEQLLRSRWALAKGRVIEPPRRVIEPPGPKAAAAASAAAASVAASAAAAASATR